MKSRHTMNRTVEIQYVPKLPTKEEMKARYNSSYHKDMKEIIESPLDSADSWYPQVSHLMRRKPWGHVVIKKNELTDLLALGSLAYFRPISTDEILESLSIRELCERLQQCITENGKDGVNIFCRINECSMKRSRNSSGRGIRGYNTPMEMITAMIDDPRIHGWLSNLSISGTFFLLSDFDPTVSVDNEYRVFVYKGKVTGISPACWFQVKAFMDHKPEELSARIINFVESEVVPCFNYDQPTFVADVIVDSSISLIEINKFGGHTGCGSALFHWKRDEDILYDQTGNTVMRILYE